MEGITCATDWAVGMAVAGGVAVTATVGMRVYVTVEMGKAIAEGCIGSRAAVRVGSLVAVARGMAAVLQDDKMNEATRAIPINLLNTFSVTILHTLSFLKQDNSC
jgi:hypothetical protein